MKTVSILSLVVCLAIILSGVPAYAQEGGLRYTISVSKFENRAGWRGYWDLGDAWGTVMTDMLHQTGQFIVLGETDMRGEALAEQDLAASGATAQGAKTPVTGQMTPAQLLVKGAITHVQDSTTGGRGGVRIKGFRVGGKKDTAEINATIYIVDSTTGQIVATSSVVGESDRKGARFGYSGSSWGANAGVHQNENVGKAVESAVSDSVEWMLTQLPSIPWTGTVALAKDGKVYVNRGSREGVSPGQTFVVGDVDVIRDPETGEVLDESMNEVARLQVDSIKEKLSICSVISGDSSGVQKGMRVHLP